MKKPVRLIALFLLLMSSLYALAGGTADHNDQEFKRAYPLINSDPDQALEIGVATQRLAKEASLAYEQANALYIQAWVLDKKKQSFGEAFHKYLEACEILKDDHQQSEKAEELYVWMLFHTGRVLFLHSAHEEANRYFDEAIEVAKNRDDHLQLARLHWFKAQVFRANENADLALSEINQAIDYARASGDETMLLNTLNSKGITLIDKGEYLESRKLFTEINDHAFHKADANHFRGIAWNNTGLSFMNEGHPERAINAYEIARTFKKKDPSPYKRFINLRDLCKTYLHLKNFTQAEEYGLLAIDLYDSAQITPENYNLYDYMHQVAYAQGNYELAHIYANRFKEESNKFLKVQKELMNTRNHYQMEVLAAGFFTPLDTSYRADRYALLLWIVSASFTLLIAAGLTKQHLTKRAAARALREIQNDSWL